MTILDPLDVSRCLGVFNPGYITLRFHSIPCPTKTIADPLPTKNNHCYLIGGFSCTTVTKFLKEAVAIPTWVQSAITTNMVCGVFCVKMENIRSASTEGMY